MTNDMDFDWIMGLTDDQIGVNLKKQLKMVKPDGEMFIRLGWGDKFQR